MPALSHIVTIQGGIASLFEEVAPVGTVTPMHLHHDSDEVANSECRLVIVERDWLV
jgi:hypothetical protein